MSQNVSPQPARAESPDLAGASESCANNDEVPPEDNEVHDEVHAYPSFVISMWIEKLVSMWKVTWELDRVQQVWKPNFQVSSLSEVRVSHSMKDTRKLPSAWLWSWSFHFGNSSNMRLAVGMWWNGAPAHGEAILSWQHKMLGMKNKNEKREHVEQIWKIHIKKHNI